MGALEVPRRLPPGCCEDVDRHGNVRVYFRAKNKPKVRLRGMPWSPEFMAEYEAAKGAPLPSGKGGAAGTWRWLVVRYFSESTDYKRLDPKTQHTRRGILENTFDEPIAPGSAKLFRDFPLHLMTSDAIEVLRDRKLAVPEGANNRVKAIRAVFRWAVRKKGANGKKLVANNPARDVPYFSTGSAGWHTWTVEEVRQFEARHPIGSKARLAMALLLFTGGRRSDVVQFGRQHVKDGKLTFTVHKGRKRNPKRITLPILPALQSIIDASPCCGDMTFLVTEFGRPFTAAGFGNWLRDRCVEAGVPGRAHGLRKAGATIAAMNGATTRELMAIFAWDSIKMAEKYTRAAEQERLAAQAMHRISTEQTGDESCPTFGAGGTKSIKE